MALEIAIIGGGPAGLRAAEVAAQAGARVTVFDAKPSVGRKLLVAGRGGLNLTHGEDFEGFVTRYSGPDQPDGFWRGVLEAFTSADLRAWAAGLGIETFQQRTGRVYPREMKAAPLLRRWIERLRGLGVTFHMNHRWTALHHGARILLGFDQREHACDAVILAMGGASWPITGSDGGWVPVMQNLGIRVNPLVPANCGWEHAWPAEVLAIAEGQPLKNIAVRAGNTTATGELMVTAYGLEGGAIYQLGAALRAMTEPVIEIDFKPTFTADELARKLESVKHDRPAACRERWKLSAAAHAILTHGLPADIDATTLARRAKACPIPLTAPRPIAEAISSAGGVCWSELDASLMLKKLPGVYVAGEMIDWEAPTGGYLMQGCFATGTHAAKAALQRS
ncbi:TIGR03862 family flavoprotein [Luteolibacter sp. LG18]|uniref:NAD(P)/FAD-dependent oxidoreductase n=1 Tax=Luteolibacter sp. LG18 TaxID=2819286 RepID=UPI002B2C180E|nr:dehydrogenase [Luteolibacter sp. LG18]